MYLQGLLILILNLLLNISSTIDFSILITIVLGFLTNKIYLNYAKNEINNIKIEHPNVQKQELKEICTKAGGTNISQAILLGFVFFLFIEAIIMIGVFNFIN